MLFKKCNCQNLRKDIAPQVLRLPLPAGYLPGILYGVCEDLMSKLSRN